MPGSRYSFAGVLADFNGDSYSFADLRAGRQAPYPCQVGLVKERAIGELGEYSGGFIRDPQCITCGDVDGDGDLTPSLANTPPRIRQANCRLLIDANDGHPAYLLINDGTGDLPIKPIWIGAKHRRTYSASFVDLDGPRFGSDGG